MKKTLRLLLVPVLAGVLCLAQPATEAQAEGNEDTIAALVNYVPNFVADVLDIFRINVSVGNGYGIGAMGTVAIGAGIADYEVTRYGLNSNEGLVIDDDADARGAALLGFGIGDGPPDAYNIGVGLHCFGGLQVAANLRSMLDAMTGLFFIDLEDDDLDYF